MLFAELAGQDWATIIAAIFLGVGQLYVIYRQEKVEKKVEEVRHNTNSLKDELVKITGEAEHAKGVLEGESRGRSGVK